jgi:predicted RNA-binding protein Jag
MSSGPSQAIFENELVRELNRFGSFAMQGFKIPETNTRLDIYIASPVRAFVEIKLLGSEPPPVVRGLIQQAEHLREQFGDEILPIVVIGGEGWSLSATNELIDAGFFICRLPKDASAAVPMTAKRIRMFLMQRSYDFKGRGTSIEPRFSTGMRSQAVPPRVAMSERQSFRRQAPQQSSKGKVELSELELAMMESRPTSGRDVDLSKLEAALADSQPASDIFFDVLISLKSILVPDKFEVLEQELAAFSEEYRHAHYTACALRIGRTLEHVVYALACAWGVNVNRKTLRVLSNLDQSYSQLSEAVIAYATADELQKAKRMQAVQERLVEFQKNFIQLNFDIHSELRAESSDIAVNVESIIRDIRKQYGRHGKVLKAVETIINAKLIRRILDVRNDAAHASTSGVRRELTKGEIDAAVELLRSALFQFGNVAFAIAQKE